jgi:plastocyanin
MPAKKIFLPSLVVSAAVALGAAGTASASDQKVIKAKDACDPVSFNAVLGDGACVRSDGGSRVTFDELVADLMDKGEQSHWKFNHGKVKIDPGESLRIEMGKGGEGHTFTEVPAYGPGCVPEVNQLIRAQGPPAGDCAQMEATYVGPDRTAFEVGGLGSGTHYFECLIHPWMQTTVVVR